MLMHYHPGAFARNKWTCCLQRGRTILGCQPTYHLLTRSSSRYAAMRRKDTLTNSTNAQRRTRAGSRGSHAYSDHDRRSIPASVLTDVDDMINEGELMGRSLPQGQGRSNSYLELSENVDDMFILSSPPEGSRRSSKNSTEQSTGVGSMVLSHTAISEVSLGKGQVLEQQQPRQRSGSHTHMPKHLRSERGRVGGRSQVAPAWPTSTPVTTEFPPQENSYSNGPSTLPRSFKATGQRLTNSWTHTQTAGELEGAKPVGEEPPCPTRPPRLKKSSSQRCSGSPLSSSSSRAQGRSPSRPRPNGLRHSKTFMVQSQPRPQAEPTTGRGGERYLQGKTYGFSQSMGTLAKPLIEPKVCVSNPNVIHV